MADKFYNWKKRTVLVDAILTVSDNSQNFFKTSRTYSMPIVAFVACYSQQAKVSTSLQRPRKAL